jgi:hypothetical protein
MPVVNTTIFKLKYFVFQNENFHREFKDIFDKLRSRLGNCNCIRWHKSDQNPEVQIPMNDEDRDPLNGNLPENQIRSPDLPDLNGSKAVAEKSKTISGKT